MRASPILPILIAALMAAPAAVRADDTPRTIVGRLDKAGNTADALADALRDLDGYVAAHPDDGLGHYARGMVLSRLGRRDQAVAAYDIALAKAPDLADAAYNAAVVLLDAGKEKEAIRRLERALVIDPRHVDAAYNLGQVHYNRKEFAAALAAWQKARKLAPGDFDAAKKVLQAYHALGKTRQAAKARAEVVALWKAGKDPRVARLTRFVFDQFDVAGWHVYAYETFDPEGDLYYVYSFTVTGPGDTVVGSVNVESSAAIREQGVPYILGVDKKDGAHKTLGTTWKKLPPYQRLKPLVVKTIEAEFGKRP